MPQAPERGRIAARPELRGDGPSVGAPVGADLDVHVETRRRADGDRDVTLRARVRLRRRARVGCQPRAVPHEIGIVRTAEEPARVRIADVVDAVRLHHPDPATLRIGVDAVIGIEVRPEDHGVVDVPNQDSLTREEEVVLLVAERIGWIVAGEPGALDHLCRGIAIQVDRVVPVQVGHAVLDQVVLVAAERDVEEAVHELGGADASRVGTPRIDELELVGPEVDLAPRIEARRKNARCLGDLAGPLILDQGREQVAGIHVAPDSDRREKRVHVVEVGQTLRVSELVTERSVQRAEVAVLVLGLRHDHSAEDRHGAVVHEHRVALIQRELECREVARTVAGEIGLEVGPRVEDRDHVEIPERDRVRLVGLLDGVLEEAHRLVVRGLSERPRPVIPRVAHPVGQGIDLRIDVVLDDQVAVRRESPVPRERLQMGHEERAVVRRRIDRDPERVSPPEIEAAVGRRRLRAQPVGLEVDPESEHAHGVGNAGERRGALELPVGERGCEKRRLPT